MTNIAILGCGKIAYAMAKTLRMMRDQGEAVCLYAAASRTLDKAQAFAASEGFAHAYGSYEELVKDPNVQLVYIASPHSHHAEHMKLCIEHGKAVLCEKAFTANAAQAKEVVALAKEKNVLVAEAIWTRYMPSRKIIWDTICSGALGEVKLLQANLHYLIEHIHRLRTPELAGGALLDVGVYPLNFACMFFGDDFVRMDSSVQMMETGVDRQESFSFYYADGRAANMTAGMSCRSDRSCLIAGTKGYLTVDNVNNPLKITLYKDEEDFSVAHDLPVPAQLTGYEYEVRACMKALEEGKIECPEMPHSDSVRVMEICDALRAQWGLKYPFE
ncbi:MAG: Gfo/Idh/MocA family oxidoreductase [Eubacteriales bacterium]|nr:Gfo/Idh/MocA family oxidoreductase [Eubacteriales bacterium]